MAKTKKNFEQDIKAAFGKGSYQKGLQALKKIDRQRITVADPKRLAGRADIDVALMKKSPNANRWDYVVGSEQSAEIVLHWVEVHPARTDENLREVLGKLEWLRSHISGARLDGYRPRYFVWIASGKTAFSPQSPQRKRLAEAGCELKGHLQL